MPNPNVLRARLGGLARVARGDSEEMAATARRGFMRKFDLLVDPNNELEPAERERRANAALRAHMTRLALKRKR